MDIGFINSTQVKNEKIFTSGIEYGLRIASGCTLLAMALNHKQFSLFDRSINLSTVRSWTDWSRHLIFSHMILHDAYFITKGKNKSAQGKDDYAKAKAALPMHLAITLLTLHENKILRLNSDLLTTIFSGMFFLSTAETLAKLEHKKVNTYAKLANAVVSPLWMASSLLGIGGDVGKGLLGIGSGTVGLWNAYENGWNETK